MELSTRIITEEPIRFTAFNVLQLQYLALTEKSVYFRHEAEEKCTVKGGKDG